MAASVTHSKVSAVPPTADPDLVSSDDWNDDHVVSITAADLGAAPSTVDYLVGTASAGLSGEIVAGATPGGELGGTWAAPTVDTTHAGSAHGAAVITHEAAGDPHPGYVREDLMDVAGDLIVASGDNAVARLAKGTTGQMLQAQASSLAWIDYQRSITWTVDGVLPSSRVGKKKWRNRTGRTLTLVRVELEVDVAPTTQSILVDLNIGTTSTWSTVFSTQGNRPAIAAAALNGSTTTFNTTTIADGDFLIPDLDQAGTGTTGADLTITVWLKG